MHRYESETSMNQEPRDPSDPFSHDPFAVADLVMDVVKRKITRAGKEIRLTQTEFSLLEFFLRNKNKILTRRRIAEQVWGYKFETGTNIVDVYISYLRQSIENGDPTRLIETVRGEGFILRDDTSP